MSNQDGDGNGGDGKDGGDSAGILEQKAQYFMLPSGRIRVKVVRHGSRIFLEVIAVDGTIDLVPLSNKTMLIGTRSLNIQPPAAPYPRVRRSKAPLLPGRKPADGG